MKKPIALIPLKMTRKGYSALKRTLAIKKGTLVLGGLSLERNSLTIIFALFD